MQSEVEEAKDLLKYFKRVEVCGTCGKIYGTDLEEDNGQCPFCEENFLSRKSRFNKFTVEK